MSRTATKPRGGVLSRRLVAVLAAAVLPAVAGCGNEYLAGTPAVAEAPAGGKTGAAESEPENGFDECGLIDKSTLAETLGVEAMYVTARSTLRLTDGSQQASCTYFPEEVPGMLGMAINTVVDTDPARFFAPFDKYEKKLPLDGLGERAELVAYGVRGGPARFIEIRAIDGDRGIYVFYSYSDNGGQMPEIEADAIKTIVGTALDQLPDEVTFPDGSPRDGCADIDLGSATETVGAELVRARSVVSDDGAMNCQFSGGGAAVEVTVIVDADLVEQHALSADLITYPDVGDGARLTVLESGTLKVTVNDGDQVITIGVIHGDGAGEVTEPRPDDVELVRSITDSIGEQG